MFCIISTDKNPKMTQHTMSQAGSLPAKKLYDKPRSIAYKISFQYTSVIGLNIIATNQ